jgi:hypothetical protein
LKSEIGGAPTIRVFLLRLSVAAWESILPKMFVCKRTTGSSLQLLLECGRALIVIKTDRRYNTPWCVLGSVEGAALIVSGYSLLEVGRQPDIALFGI